MLEEGDFCEERLYFFNFLTVDVVKHILVVHFIHDGKLAVSYADDACSSRQDAVGSVDVFGKSELTEGLSLPVHVDWHH